MLYYVEKYWLYGGMAVDVIVVKIVAVFVVFMVSVVSVHVTVGVFMGMSVNYISVAVLVAVNMCVHMGMLKFYCIFHNKYGSGNHN